MIRFNAFGRLVGVTRADGEWAVYYLSDDGKRRQADFAIPSFVSESELEQFLFDLLHEFATPRHGEVRRLPAP